MTNPSFFFAIFKKLQVCETAISNLKSTHGGLGHFTPASTSPPSIMNDGPSGGVTLTHPSDPNGILGVVLECSSTPTGLAGKHPLPQGTAPEDSPLYLMLNTCLTELPPPPPPPTFTQPVGMPPLPWPVMPYYGDVSMNLAWQQYSAALVPALYTWIKNGQVNDEPLYKPLFYPTLTKTLPAEFPNLTGDASILFVCSMLNDDGRRISDVPPGPSIPWNYWATSLIFLQNERGLLQTPSRLESGKEYYVVAAIGNSGNINAGRLPTIVVPPPPTIEVECYAMALNSYYSPAVQLPPLSNLDVSHPNLTYEQYFLAYQYYDVVGFRFNVDSVFGQLATALESAPVNMGNLAAEAWLKNSYASVQVLIVNGESPPNPMPPMPLMSSPVLDRHIAQKSLVQFEILTLTPQEIPWWNFVVAQAPPARAGLNRLQIRPESLPETFSFLLALPTQPFEDYIRKEGGIEGFEVVRDASSKPFPDAVILRETSRGSLLEVASHEREPFLGFSLGIEYDATGLKPGPVGTVSVVQLAPDDVVGGFTIEVTMGGARA